MLSHRVKEYEYQIDQMVCKLYGLTEEEIKIVGGKNEKKCRNKNEPESIEGTS